MIEISGLGCSVCIYIGFVEWRTSLIICSTTCFNHWKLPNKQLFDETTVEGFMGRNNNNLTCSMHMPCILPSAAAILQIVISSLRRKL